MVIVLNDRLFDSSTRVCLWCFWFMLDGFNVIVCIAAAFYRSIPAWLLFCPSTKEFVIHYFVVF